MNRRFPDLMALAPKPWTWVDTFLVGLLVVIFGTVIVGGAWLLLMMYPPHATGFDLKL